VVQDSYGKRTLSKGKGACAITVHAPFLYGGPLDEGHLIDDVVECPWHAFRFFLEDGSVKAGLATAPIPAHDVRVQDRRIEVKAKSQE
jgi:nitrite reductase/ring-hydroxylating ferredoxin subunit